MSLVLIAALVGALLGFLIYRRNPEGTEKKTKIGLAIWKLFWIPVYILIMFAIIQQGDLEGAAVALSVTALLVILILVFRPDQDIKQYRTQG